MSRPSAAQDVAIAALMIAVIEVCKLFMQAMPNIELTSFLLILFTLRFGRLTHAAEHAQKQNGKQQHGYKRRARNYGFLFSFHMPRLRSRT